MVKATIKESDLYEPVKQWLEERGYDVYPEVQREQYGWRADIVALAKPAVCIVELKTSLSMDLIKQALHRKRYAHYVYVGLPRGRKYNSFAESLLQQNGIGILYIDPDSKYLSVNTHYNNARFNRVSKHITDKWFKLCTEHHKNSVPGGHAGGDYVTPYNITMRKVAELLEDHPEGLTIRQILDYCETHYQNPKAGLSKALRTFENKWVRGEKRGNTFVFTHRKFTGGELNLDACHSCEQKKPGWGLRPNLSHCRNGKWYECSKILTGEEIKAGVANG